MRLTEQAKILKEEIRRLERNQARENAISNMEYLKNIVFKVRHFSTKLQMFIWCRNIPQSSCGANIDDKFFLNY